MKISRSMLVGASVLALKLRFGISSAGHRCPRFARRHHDDRRKTNSTPRTGFRRGDQGEGLGVDGLVGSARRPAEGRAQRIADHD
jgi:hypothetical protein